MLNCSKKLGNNPPFSISFDKMEEIHKSRFAAKSGFVHCRGGYVSFNDNISNIGLVRVVI